MNESNLADAGSDEQETGIQVDLDADDGKAVTRARPRTVTKAKDWNQERADTSKAVKKRIDRIANRFNQQLADQQAEHQREIAELRDKFSKIKTGGDATNTDEAAHQKAMDALQAELEEAQERGDSKQVSVITRRMGAAEAKFWADKTAAQTQGASENETRAAGKPNGGAKPADGTGGRAPTKAGVEWANANGEWWRDTVDELAIDARAYANSIHARMLADGEHDPETPEYFERIGALVRKRFPEIEVKSTGKGRRAAAPVEDFDEADDPDAQPARRGPPSLPNRGALPRGENVRTLTRADLATMRQVGMNPDDNKHVVQFLRSKAEQEADA